MSRPNSIQSNLLSSVVWPATVIILAVIAAPTLLIILGHSADARANATVVGQGVGFLAQLWVVHASRKPTEQHLAQVEDAVTGPDNEDLQAQLKALTTQLGKIQRQLAQATGA